MTKTIQKRIVACLLLGFPVIGFGATEWEFYYENNCTAGGCNDNVYNEYDWDRTYHAVGDTSALVTAYGISNTVAGTTNGNLQQAQISAWNGMGVHNEGESYSSPQHSMDNNGDFEAIVLDFGAGNLMDLQSVNIGWSGSDSDITVMAFTGTGTPDLMANLSPTSDGYTDLGLTYADVASSWQLIGSYSDLAVNSPEAINGGGVESRYWLISAYNPALNNKGWSTGNDYVKLQNLTGSIRRDTPPPSVPEPATVLLMSLGLGFIGTRRRFSKA